MSALVYGTAGGAISVCDIASLLGPKPQEESLAVTIAIDQDAISVLGPITNAQLRASPVPVASTFAAPTQQALTTLTAIGASQAVDTSLALGANFFGTVANSTSNLSVRLRGRATGGGWVNMEAITIPSGQASFALLWESWRGAFAEMALEWVSGSATSVAIVVRVG